MKKKIVLTLELDTTELEPEPTEDEIKTDIEREINCTSYSYNVERIEFL